MALIIAALFIIVFVANVAMGSVSGNPILGNVPEMLLLFGASICFVIAVLKKETERDEAKQNQN